MASSELRQKVTQALSRPGYGATAEEVLTACCLVAQVELNLSKDEIMDIQNEFNVSPQTWKRMVSVSGNHLLRQNAGVMPANFSSLYRLSLLNHNALRQGMDDGRINPKITTREIESMKKGFDIRSRFKTSKHSLFLFCKNELDDAVFAELLLKINQIASEYDACIDTQNLIEIHKENNRRFFDIHRQSIELLIDSEISLLVSPAAGYDGVSLGDSARMALKELSLDLSFGDFVKTLKVHSKNREEMMSVYGRLYCLKLAHEYWKTDSRTQRYNYKKRLKDVEALYPKHARYARWVLETQVQVEDDNNLIGKPDLPVSWVLDDET